MNSFLDNRYDISRYLSAGHPLFPQKIQEPEFQKLEEKYQQRMQSLSSDPGMQQLMNNKVVTALFLDKVRKTAHQPEALALAKKYGYSSSTIDSMQIIHYLETIREDPRLAPDTRKVLSGWVETEREYLDLAIIMDGWRAENKEMVGLIKSGSLGLKKIQLPQPPIDEVQMMAKSIARKFSMIKPGQSFKMLGGYNIHETRLLFKNNGDNTFTLYHFNTARKATLEKYININADILDDPKFWQKFIQTKLGSSDIQAMNKLLASIGTIVPLTREEKLAAKSRQSGDSCPAQAAEADLKCDIVLSSSDPSSGEHEYKLAKSIMAEQAVRIEKGRIDPGLYTLLERKNKIKDRYLKWRELEHKPVKLQQVGDLFQTLISVLETSSKKGEITTIRELRELDKKLEDLLKKASKEKLKEVLEIHDVLWPQGGSPLAGLKFRQEVVDVKEAVQAHLSEIRSVPALILGMMRTLLPASMKKLLDYPHLRVGTMVKYLRNEKAVKALPILEEMLKHGLVSSSDVEELFFDQIETQDIEMARGIAKLALKIPGAVELHECALALLDPAKANLNINRENWQPTLQFLAMGGHRDFALAFVKKLMMDKELDEVMSSLCEMTMLPNAWILEALNVWMNLQGDRTDLSILPLRNRRFSMDERRSLIDGYLKASQAKNVDALADRVVLDAKTIRYFYKEKNRLSPKAAERLFINAPRDEEWQQDLPVYLSDKTLSLLEANRLFRISENTIQKKQIAILLLERENLPAQQRVYYRAFLNPDEFLAEIANKPEFLMYSSAILEFLNEEQVLRLAEIAIPHTHTQCFGACLSKLSQNQTVSLKIERMVASFLREGSRNKKLTQTDAGFLLNVLDQNWSSGDFIQKIYQICTHHFGAELNDPFSKNLREQGLI